jgi:hypothetical protein
MVRGLALIALAGCGRIGFDPVSADASVDIAIDSTLEIGLIAHYKFDDDPSDGVLDSSGRGHTGVCRGPCPSQVQAQFDGGYLFDGLSTMIEVPHAPDFVTANGVTVSVWVNLAALAPTSAIAGKVYGVQVRNSWQLVVDGDASFIICTTSTPTSGLCVDATSALLSLGAWHHVAYVWTTTSQQGWLDGIQWIDNPISMAWDTGSLWFGGDMDSSVPMYFLNGILDDLRIYDRALAPSELATLATP